MGRRRGVNVRQLQSANRQTSSKDPSPVRVIRVTHHLRRRISMDSSGTPLRSLAKSSKTPCNTGRVNPKDKWVTNGQYRIVIAIAALANVFVLTGGKQLTPLVCNSVNDLHAMNEETNFVYVTTRGKDCTFVFEGPPEAQLDIKLHSLSTEGQAKNTCKNPPVRLYTYSTKNQLRQLEQVLCAEDDAVRTVTDTNTAIISSTLRYGSFFVRVRPLSSLTTRILPDRTKPLSNFVVTQRRTDASTRRRSDLFRLVPNFSEPTAIDGMFPPDLQSIDFFGAMNQFEIPLRFRAQPQDLEKHILGDIRFSFLKEKYEDELRTKGSHYGVFSYGIPLKLKGIEVETGFVPSAYYQTPGNPQPTDSYGAPVTAGPLFWGVYPGRPGLQVDITSTQSPVEWVTANQTATGSEGTTTYTVHPETTPTVEITTGSVRPTESTTTIEPTRYTEPLTSPTEPTTGAQTTPPPEKVSEELSSSETANIPAIIRNSPTFIQTEVLSKEEAKQVRDGDSTGYLIVI